MIKKGPVSLTGISIRQNMHKLDASTHRNEILYLFYDTFTIIYKFSYSVLYRTNQMLNIMFW